MCVNILTSLFSDFLSSNPLLERLKSHGINRRTELRRGPSVGRFIYSVSYFCERMVLAVLR